MKPPGCVRAPAPAPAPVLAGAARQPVVDVDDEQHRLACRLLGREPSLVEMGVLAALWSEHCSYCSSRSLLARLPAEAPWVLQGPGENAGAVLVEPGLALCFKMESHNHPTFLEPFQGAATGLGGILRDVFAMGARPFASIDLLHLGSPDSPLTRRLLDGVVRGIAFYGNCMGVPTVGGQLRFSPGYEGNPLVNVLTIGVVAAERLLRRGGAPQGAAVYYAGNPTGRDGLHGATMASAAFTEQQEDRRPAVQVGDPFTGKVLMELCLELAGRGLLAALQDMGAAGLASAAAEMAAGGEAGTGILLELEQVPRREPGLSPYELLLSESQERMLLAVLPEHEGQVREELAFSGLAWGRVGTITGDGLLTAREDGDGEVCLPVPLLTGDAPRRSRPARRPAELEQRWQLPWPPGELPFPEPADLSSWLRRLVGSPNLCSRRWVWEQYDHMVGLGTVLPPGADAAVVRIPGTSRLAALTVDVDERLCWLDPRRGARAAVAEAARNLACVGAQPLGISDCLNLGSPERAETMWELQECVEGLREACLALAVPVVSGNVSLYNETSGRGIPPTPTVAMVGMLPAGLPPCTCWWSGEGDEIWLLGASSEAGLAGSEYLDQATGLVAGRPPEVDLELERSLGRLLRLAHRGHLLRSAHDLAEGGLGVALWECCQAPADLPRLGARLERLPGRGRADLRLFGEAPGRVLVSVHPGDGPALAALAAAEGVVAERIGRVGGARLCWSDRLDLALEAEPCPPRPPLEGLDDPHPE